MLRIVSGKYKSRQLKSIKGSLTRPTSGLLREAVFNKLQSAVVGARVLDVCAGTGAMGLEALSRGAAYAAFIEKNSKVCSCIRDNITMLDCAELAEVYCGDAMKVLSHLGTRNEKFDLIYIDPPYDEKLSTSEDSRYFGQALVYLVDQISLLNQEGRLFLETRHNLSNWENLKNLEVSESRTYGKSNLTILRRASL